MSRVAQSVQSDHRHPSAGKQGVRERPSRICMMTSSRKSADAFKEKSQCAKLAKFSSISLRRGCLRSAIPYTCSSRHMLAGVDSPPTGMMLVFSKGKINGKAKAAISIGVVEGRCEESSYIRQRKTFRARGGQETSPHSWRGRAEGDETRGSVPLYQAESALAVPAV